MGEEASHWIKLVMSRGSRAIVVKCCYRQWPENFANFINLFTSQNIKVS